METTGLKAKSKIQVETPPPQKEKTIITDRLLFIALMFY